MFSPLALESDLQPEAARNNQWMGGWPRVLKMPQMQRTYRKECWMQAHDLHHVQT
jgi:hypothetical protein